MEVPNSPSVKSPIPGAVPGNGGFSKAESPPETSEKGWMMAVGRGEWRTPSGLSCLRRFL
jgi:hypothetical protein